MIYKFNSYVKPEIMRDHLKLGGADAHGNKISVNSLYIEKNGNPTMEIMGEMHFSRVPKSQWEFALKKMKAGGIDIVATYIIWIYHERNEGQFDWSGDNDLRAFCELAKEIGLQVCVRIGPWCHGEVRNGGFPDWLLKKDCKLRTNDRAYLELVEKWYGAIFEQIDGLLFKQGGPITMCQLENELTDNAAHLLTLKHLAQKVGIDVPIYTVTGWNAISGAKIPVDDVIPTFGGYCDAPWDEGVDKLPPCSRYYFTGVRNDSAIGKDLIKAKEEDDWELPYMRYPYATCEIGAGLMNTYHRRYKIHGMDIYSMTLIMLCEGANLLGYYMYHGGINKMDGDYTLQESKETGYPNDYPYISYDFQAPISSYGETRESYDLLNLLHLFIHEYGKKLAGQTYVAAETSPALGALTGLRYGMRRDENGGFVFINNYQRLHELPEVKDVVIDTGEVLFPAINVKSKVAFFMPFNMDLGNGVILEYATAQPLCKSGDNWLFLEIPGVKPDFKFALEDKTCQIILLNLNEAKRLRKVEGKVYFEEPGKTIEALMAAKDSDYVMEKLDAPAFELPDMLKKELCYKEKPITWYKLSVQGTEGFIDIDVKFDVAQLYVDEKLIDDEYYHGMPWRLPKKLLFGKKAYIVTSEFQNEGYMEV